MLIIIGALASPRDKTLVPSAASWTSCTLHTRDTQGPANIPDPSRKGPAGRNRLQGTPGGVSQYGRSIQCSCKYFFFSTWFVMRHNSAFKFLSSRPDKILFLWFILSSNKPYSFTANSVRSVLGLCSISTSTPPLARPCTFSSKRKVTTCWPNRSDATRVKISRTT